MHDHPYQDPRKSSRERKVVPSQLDNGHKSEIRERPAPHVAPLPLGGPERRTLFLLSSTDAYPQRLVGTRLSRFDAVTVATPGAGLP